jgi:hypothetical protein
MPLSKIMGFAAWIAKIALGHRHLYREPSALPDYFPGKCQSFERFHL